MRRAAAMLLHSPRARMRIFADRFGYEDASGAILDLATGEQVRLFVEPLPGQAIARARVETCDRLASVRHPLLLPYVDYGIADGRWFEAHAAIPPLRASGAELRRAALHLVRFLRGCGIELTRELTDRNVRAAVEDAASPWRPIGVRLCPSGVMEVVDSVFHGGGPPGVTRLAIAGAHGSGLRTLRMQAARMARVAGFAVLDRQFTAGQPPMDPARHYCVVDWLTDRQDIPPVVADAAIRGGRRHVWLRFRRQPAPAALTLAPLTSMELMQMVFADPELGPTREELQSAALRATGLPGPYLEDLARRGRSARRGIVWVHETAAPYVVCPEAPLVGVPVAGIARLLRLVEAATALAERGRHAHAERLLRRAGAALHARGAADASADAAVVLARILITRGRASAALAVLAEARTRTVSPARIDAILLETGRAMRDLDRAGDAEGVCRTVLAAASGRGTRDAASILLAEVLMHSGELSSAAAALAPDLAQRDAGAAALASTLALGAGDLRRAADLASRAINMCGEGERAAASAAHAAAMRVQAELSHPAGFEEHARLALRAAQGTRNPVLRWVLSAEILRLRQDMGASMPVRARRRALAIAGILPPLAARRIHAFLSERVSRLAVLAEPDPVERLEQMLGLVYDAPGDAHAAGAVAAEIARCLRACSVSIRGAARQQVAVAGRPWTSDAALADLVLNGGAGLMRDAPMPEAAEPIKAGGATIGCIAARWMMGGGVPPARAVRESLRMAAAAVAPVVAALNAPPPDAPAAGYPDDLLGPGPAAGRVREVIRRAARTPYPVLIEGESGSGKELVALAVHARSARRSRPLCAVNCAALTEDLLEAELFGHVRGAFTGAVGERRGLFEEADQGTLFLDEVTELSPRAQAKLLRVLQDGEVRRVGENVARRIDVRVVAATNRALGGEVERGAFRADLRFRLDVIRIAVPPLRERPDEVPWLAERIWADAATRVGTCATLSSDLMAALSRYGWPGNVRELQNVLAAVAVHAPRRGRVPASLLPPHVAQLAARTAVTFDSARHEFECRFVRAALARAGGRRGAAARQLGVSRQGLAKMMKRLGIVEPS